MVKIIVFLLLICSSTNAFSYDKKQVHPAINETAAYQANNLIDWLHSTGLIAPNDVLGKIILGRTVSEWFQQGGTDEDTPESRALNHFHDPLESWEDAGLPFSHSALVWAQRGSADYPVPNRFSWRAARDYFYSALTTGQEAEYALTFRSIGQVMHLVSDMAVPAHVRKDSHLTVDWLPSWIKDGRDPYESWAKDNVDTGKIDFTGLHVDQTIFNNFVSDASASAPYPISALWDQDKYNLPTPDPSVTKVQQ